ncbi:MAG: tandem-95 repeat protein, partial [Gloeobacteraceae cyanobacterium ES-bin-144]|nr:tandem-95 repeat protein [Verrucomicrobiales bacterium]
PVANAQAVSTDEDTPLGITLSGSDIDGDTLTTFSVTVQPLHGTLTGTGANRNYTPEANYFGPDSFTFTTSDGEFISTPATVSITVNPVNDMPLAIAKSISVNEDNVLTTTLAGSDVEGSPLTYTVVNPPVNGTVTLAGAVATYTPYANFHGPDSFSFTVSDGTVTSTSALVSAVVNPVDEFTQWLAASSLNGDPCTDSDGDSICNALEFVLGGDPAEASDTQILPTTSLESVDLDFNPGNEDYLLFSHRRTHTSQIDPSPTVKVEWATRLAGPWTSADETVGVVNLTDPGVDIDMVRVYVPRSLEENGLLFARLRVVIDLPPEDPPPIDE